ncbi:MAG: MerR family transcriptional regulator [Fusobacteriaceae bacterium]
MKKFIGDVGKELNIPTSTLRFYEKKGLLPHVERDKNGIRVYREEDIFWIEIIKCLRETGMSIEDIKHIVELSLQGENTEKQRKDILIEHRKKVEDEMKILKKYIEKINLKIKWYEDKNIECKKIKKN